ncbi:MAG: caspase family protein [Bacteroidota bacterium]
MKTSLLTGCLLAVILTVHAQDFVKTRAKHTNGEVLSYSPDGQFLAVSSEDKIIIYSAGSGIKVKSLEGLTGKITALAFSPDSKNIAAGTASGKIQSWRVADSQISGRTSVKAEVRGIGFPDNDQIVVLDELTTGSFQLAKQAWNWSFPHSVKNPRAFAVSKELIAFGGSTKIVHVIGTDGKPKFDLSGHTNWVRALDFHPKEAMLASSSDDGKVFLWNLETKSFDNILNDLPGRIYGLKFSSDGSAIVYAGQAIKIWSIEKKYPIFEITKIYSQVIAATVSPDGQFLAILEDMVQTFTIYDLSTLNFSPLFTIKDTKDQTPPQIFVSNPANIRNDRISVMTELLPVKGSIFDESGILSLKVNGIETPVKNKANFVINLPLTMGENVVTIEATDVNGNIAMRKFTVERKNVDGTAYDPAQARNFLFAVAIDDYKNITKLKNPVKDVTDVTKTLLSKYNFDFENVVLLKNEQATRNNIIEGMRSLIEKLTPQDNLIIYFAGHGYFDKLLNEGYWVPVEAQNTTGDFIPNSLILKILDNIDTQHTFLVADACFSGSLFASTSRGYVENVEKFRSRWGLTSGRLELVADGTDTNSPFAKNLLDFLNANSNRNFAVSELVQYVKIKTAEETSQTPLGNPIKSLGDEGGEFIFYHKKN